MFAKRALGNVQRRMLSKRAPSVLAADMLGNFEVQSQSKVHAQMRRFTPPNLLPELHTPNMYGGETLANSLLAAARIVDPTKRQQPSSLTLEFLRPGAYDSPMEFSVTKMHESHRFMQSSVFVKQNEKAAALSSVTFHFEEHGPDSLLFDPTFPDDIPPPSVMPFTESWAEEQQDSHQLSPASHVRLFLGKILGLQVKAVDPHAYLNLNKSPVTRSRFWVRANPEGIEAALPSLGEYWSPALLAYMSDFCLLGPAITARPGFRIGKMVSLNHAMWYIGHRSMARPSEWVLMDLRLIHSGNNVCLCESLIWSEENRNLLAICKQQGLIRPNTRKSSHKSDS